MPPRARRRRPPAAAGLPKKLLGLLPKSRDPYDMFFERVRRFLTGPAKRMELANSEHVRDFDHRLTVAAGEDCQAMLAKVTFFESCVKEAEVAFETGQVADIYQFVTSYKRFAVRYSRDHELVTHTVFRAYVRNLSDLVGIYALIKKRFTSQKISPTWNVRRTIKQIITPINIDKEFRKKPFEIDKRLPTDRQMATQAIKNYQLALQLYNKLATQVIIPQCNKILQWLRGPKLLETFYLEFQQSKSSFVDDMDTFERQCVAEIKILQRMAAGREYKPSVARESLKVVTDTSRHCRELIAHLRISLHECVERVYNLTLDLLSDFHDNLEYVFDNVEDAKMRGEFQKVFVTCQKWFRIFEAQEYRQAQPGNFQGVLEDLPQLFRYIAYFVFKFMLV